LPKLPELPVVQVESPVPESAPSDLPSQDLPPSDIAPPDVSPPEIELTTSNIERGIKEMLSVNIRVHYTNFRSLKDPFIFRFFG
jgi:hypothetical protein